MYVELHARSAFSFLEGVALPEELVEACAAAGMPAMALVDRDGVYGAPRFHLAAKKAGVRAHIGSEVTIHEFDSPRRRGGAEEIRNAKFKMQNAKKLALRRFRPPRRAQVEVRGGRPAEVRFGAVRGRVVELAGPWRTSGEWWTGQGWARDEWDVALEEKGGVTLYRIDRDLGSGAWFVEGSYD